MAKQKNTPAPVEPTGDAALVTPEAPAAAVDAATGEDEQPNTQSADAAALAAAGEGGTEESGSSQATDTVDADSDRPPSDDELAPPNGETVPALVLSDNHLGKVGQVIQVNAAHAEALRLGGLIDPHPNAIKAAVPEE
ncbi:hypothetical protein SSKA14_72 [Stenotrophomonas sp. SKA14]|uniref:hypothetical protein n=1 Tax=Stenotrophomonas TaxID=40323 RepID=UPI00018FF2BA|nr:hypothetical protein [Stenotrophomonas sp. SKA14]EED37066.1 hypothetical protein SSKA14_72 [Stenotrophomonas sp. SKA14]